MTRANIELVQEYFPKRTHLEMGGDGYPSNVLPELAKFAMEHYNSSSEFHKDLNPFYKDIQGGAYSNLVEAFYLRPGQVGNFSYAYKVDLVKGTIIAWENKMRWFYAPENWKEKGYECYESKNGRAGWSGWVKGKRVFETTFEELAKGKVTFDDEVIYEKEKEEV